MFFLSKKFQDNKKVDWTFRAKVIVVALIWFGVSLAVIFNLPAPGGFDRPPTQGELRFMSFLNVLECAYNAVGVVFAVFMLPAVLKLGAIKRKAIAIYIAVCWLTISWLPHITLHAYMHTTWQIIGLEIGFHWTTVAASLFLTQFLYNLMIAAAGRKPQPFVWDKSLWKHDRVHFTAITLVIGVLLYVISRSEMPPPAGPPPTSQQSPLLIISSLLDSLLFGLAVAFIVKAVPLVRSMKKDSVKLKCSFLVAAIAWNIGSWWAHTNTHTHTLDETGLVSPTTFFIIEVTFHWTVMICSAAICYNIFTLLLLAIDASKSPFSGGSTNGSKAESNIEMSQTDVSKTDAEPEEEIEDAEKPKTTEPVSV